MFARWQAVYDPRMDAIRVVPARKAKHKNSCGLLYSDVLTIKLDSYEDQSGSISGYCMANSKTGNDSYPAMGNINGDEILLNTVCNVTYCGICTLQAELNEAAKLVGSLNCPYNSSAMGRGVFIRCERSSH